MTAIWKYNINECGKTCIHVPKDAQFISCGLDGVGELAVWAAVNTSEKIKEEVMVYACGTGWEHSDDFFVKDWSFLGSVTRKPYVWHVFIADDRKEV